MSKFTLHVYWNVLNRIVHMLNRKCMYFSLQKSRAGPEMQDFLTPKIPSSEGRARVAGPDPACLWYTNGALSVIASVGRWYDLIPETMKNSNVRENNAHFWVWTFNFVLWTVCTWTFTLSMFVVCKRGFSLYMFELSTRLHFVTCALNFFSSFFVVLFFSFHVTIVFYSLHFTVNSTCAFYSLHVPVQNTLLRSVTCVGYISQPSPCKLSKFPNFWKFWLSTFNVLHFHGCSFNIWSV